MGKLEPVDCVIVLGGATGLTTSERPQLGHSGERVALAARLFHAGLTKHIVVTGDSLTKLDTPYDSPQTQTVYLLKGLGIPAEAIIHCQAEIPLKKYSPSKPNLNCGRTSAAA